MFGEAVGVKISHKVSSHLIKFGKNRQFLKILVLMNNLPSSNLPRKKISGERWRKEAKKFVTDFQFTVNLREMDLRQTERKFTRPSYTCLKCLHVVNGVFTV